MKNKKNIFIYVLYSTIFISIFFVSLMTGPGNISLSKVFSLLFFISPSFQEDSIHYTLLHQLRIPRTIMVLLSGAALSVAGVITQAIFRNSLSSPGILGISSGAALFSVLSMYFGLEVYSFYIVPLASFSGSFLVFFILIMLSDKLSGMSSLLLTGLALSAFFNSITTLLLNTGLERLDFAAKVLRWMMGSFEGLGWLHIYWTIIPVIISFFLAIWIARDLDTLHLGIDTAITLGVNYRMLVIIGIIIISLLVGIITAMVGIIGFVGLIIPHMVRMVTGAGHKRLILHSIVVGAIFLLLVDIVVRKFDSIALAPGVITGLFGAPFFLWLIIKTRYSE